MKGTTITWLLAGQSVLLLVAVGGMFSLRQQVQGLEDRLDALQAEAPAVATAGDPARARARGKGRERPRRIVSGTAASSTPSEATASGETLDDQLWSEDGREAIGDVVEEREEQERARRSERWQQMVTYRTEKAVSAVSEELGLSEAETEQVSALMAAFMDARSARWEQMHGDSDVDFAEVDLQYEETRAQIESDLVDVIGEDGLEALREEMRGGRGGWR